MLGLFFFPSPSHRIFWYSYLSYVGPIVRASPRTRGLEVNFGILDRARVPWCCCSPGRAECP